MKKLYGLVVSSLFAMARTLIAIGVAVLFVEGRYLASLGAFAFYVFTTRLLDAAIDLYHTRPSPVDSSPKRDTKPNEYWVLDKNQQPVLVKKPQDPKEELRAKQAAIRGRAEEILRNIGTEDPMSLAMGWATAEARLNRS